MKRFDLSGLALLFPRLPWDELWRHFHPTRSARGRRPIFTWKMLLKAAIVQWQVNIPDDLHFAKYLTDNPRAIELCGMPSPPSHDVISRFTRGHGHKIHVIHRWFDDMLKNLGVFENDDIAGDGTAVPLHKPQAKQDFMCFGAKSNKEKFYGLWLMLLGSVTTGLVRAFNYDKARIGQIPLMFKLLVSGIIQEGSLIFLDGIFDNKDIHAAVVFDQEGIPMITYNRKNSTCESRRDLPDKDWRGEYNPDFQDGLWFIIEMAKRSSVERTNGWLKMNSCLKEVYERSRRLHRRSTAHIHKLIVGAIVLPQIDKLVEIYTPKPHTLLEYTTEQQQEAVVT